MDEPRTSLTHQEGKYLTIRLQEELYGVNVGAILQIIAIPQITPIPNTPDYVKGVINLRGKIIPVIDLRLKFNLPLAKYDERTSIVIIRIKRDSGDIYIGIIVDTVIEVMDIQNDQIEPPPSFGTSINTGFIHGMAKVKDKVVTLLDIEQVLSTEDLTRIVKQAEKE